MIEVNNLNFKYPNMDNYVIRNASFKFCNSGLYYIVGESGSGKSTFLNLISGFLPDYEGSIKFQGRELKELSLKEKSELYFSSLSYSFQDDLTESKETVKATLMLPLEIYNLSKKEKEEKIEKVIKITGIKGLLNKECRTLSGGELKRVSLARVLIRESKCILLDEPLGPLDEKTRKNLMKVFSHLSQSHLVIVVTHNTFELNNSYNILKFRDGILSPENIIHNENKSINNISSRRKKYDFFKMVKSNLRKMFKNKSRVLFSSFATSLALISLGLVHLISNGISSSINSYLESGYDQNTILMKRKNKEYNSNEFKEPTLETYISLKSEYQDEICGVTTYYDLNYEDVFVNKNKVYFESRNLELNITSLTLRNFVEFIYYKELNEEDYNLIKDKTLDNSEIILMLSTGDLESICDLYSLNTSSSLIDSLNYRLSSEDVYIHVDISASEFKYNLEMTFKVKYALLGNQTRIVHTNQFFSSNILEEEMQFEIKNEENKDKPWAVKKSYALMMKKGKGYLFLNKVKKDKKYSHLLFQSANSFFPGINNLINLEISRVSAVNKVEKDIYYSDINDLKTRFNSSIKSVYISDNFYYCSDEGINSGFLKPIYVSSDKSKLNEIADFNYHANFNLEGFQGSTIALSQGVALGDLSGISSNPLTFQSYMKVPSLLMGIPPKNENEIIISSSLAKYLYSKEPYCLNKPLYLTCLTKTVLENGTYKNVFTDGELIIRGVVEEEKYKIYQQDDFLLDISQSQFKIPYQERNIEKAIFLFDQNSDIQKIKDRLDNLYPDYSFSLPVKDMLEGIDYITAVIGNFLKIFSLFSSLIALTLMSLVLILTVKEENRKIIMMVAQGFNKSEIIEHYFTFGLLLSSYSYVNSSIFLIIFFQLFKSGIERELGIKIGQFVPEMFVNTLFLDIVIFIFSCFVIYLVISRYLFKHMQRH